MNAKLSTMLCTNKRIEAIYEVDSSCGGFATVVRRSDGTEEMYPHCKVETVLDTLAAYRGKTLSRLRLLRNRTTGRSRAHIDFYEISLNLILMPVRYRKAVNSNHGVMAYLNVARIIGIQQLPSGQAQVDFLTGESLVVKESAAALRGKLTAGKKLWYESCYACSEELHCMRITLRRLQRLAEAGL